MQVLAIKRRLTGEWSLPGGMVKAGESVSATVNRMLGLGDGDAKPGSSLAVHRRASTGREVFIAPLAKQKDFDEAVQALLRSGVDVYSGYVDDQRNTDNAWVESRAVHFHVCHTHRARTPDQQAPDSSATHALEPHLGQCPRELGEMLPLQQPSSKASRRSKVLGADLHNLGPSPIPNPTPTTTPTSIPTRRLALRRRCMPAGLKPTASSSRATPRCTGGTASGWRGPSRRMPRRRRRAARRPRRRPRTFRWRAWSGTRAPSRPTAA
eukprot:scaffold62207_cov54-Phaeocystis_antarctica.AAC.3